MQEDGSDSARIFIDVGSIQVEQALREGRLSQSGQSILEDSFSCTEGLSEHIGKQYGGLLTVKQRSLWVMKARCGSLLSENYHNLKSNQIFFFKRPALEQCLLKKAEM